MNHLRAESLELVSEFAVCLHCLLSGEIAGGAVSSASSLTSLQGNFRVHRDPTYRPRRCGTSTTGDALQMTRYQMITGYHETEVTSRSLSELKISGNCHMFLVDDGVWDCGLSLLCPLLFPCSRRCCTSAICFLSLFAVLLNTRCVSLISQWDRRI